MAQRRLHIRPAPGLQVIEFKEDKASYLIELSRDKQAVQRRIHICAPMHAHSTLVQSRPLPQLLVKRANLVVKALPPNLDLSLPEHEKQRCLRSIAHPSISPLHSCASRAKPQPLTRTGKSASAAPLGPASSSAT